MDIIRIEVQLWLLAITVISTVCSAKILFLYPHNSASHFGGLKPLVKTLAPQHEVTVLETGGADARPQTVANASVTVWAIEDAVDLAAKKRRVHWTRKHELTQLATLIDDKALGDFMSLIPEKVVELLNADWDLLVIDSLFTNHGYAFSVLLHQTRNIPYIIFNPSFTLPYQTWSLASGGSWAGQTPVRFEVPAHSDDIYRPELFRQRFATAVSTVGELFAVFKLVHFSNGALLGVRDFTMQNYYRDSALVVSDEVRGFGHTTSHSNHLQIFGHYCGHTSSLPDDLKSFMEDDTSKGTIYVAFGTMIRFDFAPEFAIDAIFDALNELTDYRVIFSFKGKSPREVKSHVKLIEWAPQFDVLSHRNTKLFISHGGLKNLKEAICSSTPMTILPFFADQGRNAKVASALGLATILNKFTISKNIMIREILKVLQNEKFASSMRKFRAQYLDLPIGHLAETKFHVEKILRKNGKNLKHKSQGEIISSFSAFYVDLIALLIMSVIFVS